MKAWEGSEDHFEACIAAHYVARHQDTPEKTLHWNQVALNRANAVCDDRVREFYPSLYLNMGKSYEDLGKLQESRRYYKLAADKMNALPEGRYSDIVRDGVARGLQRAVD